MSKEIIVFGNIEIKNVNLIIGVDIDNILIFFMAFSGENVNGYKHGNYKIKPSRIMFSKTKAFIKSFDDVLNG